MKFCNSKYLKPIIAGNIKNKSVRMLIDTGADYTILTVPKYDVKRDSNGHICYGINKKPIKEKRYIDAEYEKNIRDNYGSFVRDKSGNFVSTRVHGFGDSVADCRLIILNSFSFDNYEFTDSYVLLDESGMGCSYDMILGTSCLRNFKITLDYENRSIDFTLKTKELALRYDGITKDVNLINSGIVLPEDIYLNEDVEDNYCENGEDGYEWEER